MINKELIELQKGCPATCVVITYKDCKDLEPKIIVNSNVSDNELLIIFKENNTHKEELNYLIITEIDKINEELQDKYYQIVKDREFYGYKLPENTIIVFTVEDKEGLKNISQELYNICVVAF